MTTTVKIITVLVAVLAIGFFVQTYRVADYKHKNETQSATIDSLTYEVNASNNALDREREKTQEQININRELNAENKTLKDQIKEVYADDEKAKDWSDVLCPIGVIDCLLR